MDTSPVRRPAPARPAVASGSTVAVPPEVAARRARTRWAVVAVAAVVAPFAAQIPSLTWPATAATLAVGTVVLLLLARGWPARTVPARPVTARRAAPWFALAAGFTALELTTFLTGSHPGFPTVSALLGPVFVDPGPRVVGWFCWLTTGYWLLQR